MSEEATTTEASDHIRRADPAGGVLVVTNDGDDPGLAAARAHAGELAARRNVPVVLYDRSEETWTHSQHPDGPMELDDERLQDREHLVTQMRELRELGAHPLGWVSTLPSISAVMTALAATGADLVVVPEVLDRKVLERALVGDSIASALRTQLDRHPDLENVQVVEIAADGSTVDHVE